MDQTTTSRHFLYAPTRNVAEWTHETNTYSLFKHGCVPSTAFFARQLADLVASLDVITQEAVICSSAYMHVPNAAGLLLNRMMETEELKSLERIHLHRERIFSYDYAKLNQAEREQSMRDFPIQFDKEKIRNKTVLIIDDAYVTGAHERAIRDYLAPYAKRLIFCYIINLTGYTATTEHEINALRVKSLMDLLPILHQPGYQLNTRVRKTIFTACLEEFSLFTGCLHHHQREELLTLAAKDGYAQLSTDFRFKMEYLKGEMVEVVLA